MSDIRLSRQLAPLHEPPRSGLRHVCAGALQIALVAACVSAWAIGWWPLSVLLWFAIAWAHHGALAQLHEAAHRMLLGSRIANEVVGIVIGTVALIPLTVYRYVHAQHHLHLGRERDPEFWPYNLPETPRWIRLVYAWLELTIGWLFTPVLYTVRTFAAWPTLGRRGRQRLLLELGVLLGSWSVVLTIVARTDTWTWFVAGHLIPAWIAGTVQTVRKFTEHMGRFGETIPAMTRTVVYSRPLGRAASQTQMYVDHHGTHHRWPGIPFHRLPEATAIIADGQGLGNLYPSHMAAVRDMLPYLRDPKLGPQWALQAGETDGAMCR